MITQVSISVALSMIGAFINLFPTLSINDQATITKILEISTYMKDAVASANWWLPLDDMFLSFRAFIGINIAILTFKLVRWISSMLSVGIIK